VFIVVKDQRGNPIPEVAVRLIAHGVLNPNGSDQSEYRHADEGGNCAWTWYPHDAPGGYTIEVNNGVQNDKPQFSRESRRVTQAELEGGQQLFTLRDAGEQPQTPGLTTVQHMGTEGYGTVAEWKVIAHAIVARLGLTRMEPLGGPQPNLRAFEAECKKVHPFAELQFTGGTPPEVRPRLHLPTKIRENVPDVGKYSRPVDFGSFGLPFFHDSSGDTDVWQPTGRPPSSQW
jgi:hypothetical protein